MTIKNKISLGLAFLFSVIVLLGGLGSFYLYRLSADARNILKDNYISLEYAQNMRQVLQDGRITPAGQAEMERNLMLQEKNITEVGEKQLTQQLRRAFESLRGTEAGGELVLRPAELARLNRLLDQVMDVNMQAMVRKNAAAEQTSQQIRDYMILILTVCALVAFSFIVNFPGHIADPIRELTAAIQEVANRNYNKRLRFGSGDEFAILAQSFNDMASRLDEYEHSSLARLIFEKRRIETIVDNLRDAILGLDEQHRILFLNPVMEQLTGLSAQAVVGRYAPDVALHNDLLRTLLAGGDPARPLKIFADDRESYFTRETLVVSLPQPAGQPPPAGRSATAGQVVVLRNITPFKELEQAKTNFIATISHELKTPISSILMSLKLLADSRVGMLNDEQRQLAANIQEDAGRLLKITGELLDLSQVESGNIRLDLQPVPPARIVDIALQAVRFQAEQQQVTLEIDVPGTLPHVQADEEKTAWVLVNLLSNAVRYSAENGRVQVAARADTDTVLFSVQDFGRGIDPRYQPRIFEKFFQVPDGSGGRSGTGLGLAIAKDFITAQGGTIGLHSELGQGSTFYFRLRSRGA